MNTNQIKSDIKKGDIVCGYTVKQADFMQGINSFIYQLEHTVLCGSQKYPVRDPFFSMLKRSLSTFMNAFTSSDWTMYPFATENKKDYYNLMEVYLDAAFFPKIEELSFKQEGHRIEVNNSESDELIYKGVVYNEMKGAMSSPDQVMSQSMLNAMYPDTTYSNNSGGDPEIIPSLTWNQLKSFHEKHYHPSNSFFYTYGSFELKDHLCFIQDKVLKHFSRIDPGTTVMTQPRWKQPKKATYYYPLAKHEDPQKKYQICMAWLMADIKDTFNVLSLSLLEHILLGNSGSPLRKVLIDSKLGTSLSDGTGFYSDNRDTLFASGLKDVSESDAEKIETIIFNELKKLAENGIDKQLIDAAIHQLEFQRKEITNTPYPYGIKLLLGLSGTWFHGGDPNKVLDLDSHLEKIHEEIAKHGFFENLIRKYFLNNSHRNLLILAPDQEMEERQIEKIGKQLKNIKAGLSETDIKKINQDANTLKDMQNENQDVSVLPTLELEDIPVSVKTIKPSENYNNIPSTFYEQPTSGIFYFTGAAGLGNLPKSLISILPFFCYAFPKIGTSLNNYTQIAQKIDEYTGGIHLSTNSRTVFDSSGLSMPFISFSGKCLERNQNKLFEIMEQIFCDFKFSDLDRLKSLILQYGAELESMVVHNGHRLAISLASRNFSKASALSEIWHGVHQIQTIKNLTDNLTRKTIQTLSQNLEAIGKAIFTSQNLKTALIAESSALSQSSKLIEQSKRLSDMLGNISLDKSDFPQVNIDIEQQIPFEGWYTSTAVSFVAETFKTVRMEHEDAPALSVISKILQYMFLHREIREKGGAYGGIAGYDMENGLFSFGSYRDPHIHRTLNTYKDAFSFIKSDCYTDEDIKEAILQVCSQIDKPATPAASATRGFFRKLISLPDQARKQFKSKLLTLNRKSVLKVAKKYFQPENTESGVAVISSQEHLQAVNKKVLDRDLNLYKI